MPERFLHAASKPPPDDSLEMLAPLLDDVPTGVRHESLAIPVKPDFPSRKKLKKTGARKESWRDLAEIKSEQTAADSHKGAATPNWQGFRCIAMMERNA